MLPSKAEFARQLGVSGAAITKAIAAGHIILDGEGRINTNDPATIKYATRPKRERKQALKAKAKAAATQAPESPPRAIVTVRPITPRDPEAEDYDEGDLDAAFLRVKIEEKTITNAARRGELVPRKIVAQFIQRIYLADTTELDQIADRLGGKLAGTARHATTEGEAAAAVRSILTDEAARIKRHIHRVQKDFVKQFPEPEDQPELAEAQG